MTVDPDYVHPAVRREADVLHAVTGHEPHLTRLDHDRWRIVMDNGRVHMFVDYRVAGRGRLHWANSALTIDGRRVRRAGSIEQFAAIFANPDGGRGTTPGPDMLPPETADNAPTLVRSAYARLVDQLPDATIGIGHQGNDWAIQIASGPVVMRLHYRTRISGTAGRRGEARCRPVSRHPFTIIVDGADRTAEFEGNMARAMAFLSGRPGEPQQHIPTVRAEPAPPRSNAVENRKRSVMRI